MPFAMKLIPVDMDRCQGVVRDLFPRWIRIGVECRPDVEPRVGGGGANQVDNHLMADQRAAPPILRDIGKQAMFNLVPFTRARGQMTDRQPQPCLIGQLLQFGLPQPGAHPIAAPAVRNEQQFCRLRVGALAHLPPPPPHRLDSKFRRVMVRPHTDPAGVSRYIVDPIRDRFAQRLIWKVVYPDVFGLALGLPLPPAIFEVTHQLFFLRIDRNDGLAVGLKRFGTRVDVFELRIPIRMRATFLGFARRLQAVAQPAQQARHCSRTDCMPHGLQLRRQAAGTLARPAQGRLGIATGDRVDQGFQRPEHGRVVRRHRLASAAHAAQTPRGRRVRAERLLVAEPLRNRRARQSGRSRHRLNPATAQRCGLGRRPQTAQTLIHKRTEHGEFVSDDVDVVHKQSIVEYSLNHQIILAQVLSNKSSSLWRYGTVGSLLLLGLLIAWLWLRPPTTLNTVVSPTKLDTAVPPSLPPARPTAVPEDEARKVSVYIGTQPNGVNVYRDGRRVATTPWQFEAPVGSHVQAVLKGEGLEDREIDIWVNNYKNEYSYRMDKRSGR